MTLIVTLFLIGLLLLSFEIITPGAVLGTLGALAMLAGSVLAWINYGPTAGLSAVAIALVLTGIVLYIELALLPKTKFGRQMYNDAAVSGTSHPPPAEASNVLGRECEALTILAPTGYVLLDGKRYGARSLDGMIDKGARLLVASLDNFTLQVTKK